MLATLKTQALLGGESESFGLTIHGRSRLTQSIGWWGPRFKQGDCRAKVCWHLILTDVSGEGGTLQNTSP